MRLLQICCKYYYSNAMNIVWYVLFWSTTVGCKTLFAATTVDVVSYQELWHVTLWIIVLSFELILVNHCDFKLFIGLWKMKMCPVILNDACKIRSFSCLQVTWVLYLDTKLQLSISHYLVGKLPPQCVHFHQSARSHHHKKCFNSLVVPGEGMLCEVV